MQDGHECDVCGKRSAASLRVHGYRYLVCRACDFAFLPAQSCISFTTQALFDDGYFHGGGAGYGDYSAEARLLRERGRRYGRLLLRKAGPLRVLDAGCASGHVLAGLIDAGHSGVGLEPNATMAAEARFTLRLDVINGTLETLEAAEPYDCVTMIQLVDHLLDLRRAFANAARATKFSGWWFFEFGNRASLTARLMRGAWHEYAPPTVMRAFSLGSLTRLCAEYGFELHAHGRAGRTIFASHAKSLLRYKAADGPFVRLLSHCIGWIPDGISLPYALDDTCWALFRRTGNE